MASNEYKNADSIITIACKCGEEFSTKFRNFKYGKQKACKTCISKEKGIVYNLETARYLINKISDSACILLSNEYVDNKTPLDIMCGCGRVFQSSITNIKVKKVPQCNFCSHNAFRSSKEELIEIASQGGCRILNVDEYENEDTYMNFVCRCGNQFSSTMASFKSNNKVCKDCYIKNQSIRQRANFDLIKEKVKNTTSKLVSTPEDYVNQYSKLTFKCPCGKRYERSLTNYLQREQLCLGCTASKGERSVENCLIENNLTYKREYSFKGLTSKKGHPLRFDFAIFDDTGLKGLVEYDGEFHYEAIISEEKFKQQKLHDLMKDNYCKKHNIPLLRIPYFNFENIEIEIENFISTY